MERYCLAKIPLRQRKALKLFWGLDKYDVHSLREIGEILKCSTSSAYRLKEKGWENYVKGLKQIERMQQIIAGCTEHFGRILNERGKKNGDEQNKNKH